jgi:hypothetical protein
MAAGACVVTFSEASVRCSMKVAYICLFEVFVSLNLRSRSLAQAASVIEVNLG